MVGHSGVFAIAPALYADPGYDPRRDFAPIGLIRILSADPRCPPVAPRAPALLT